MKVKDLKTQIGTPEPRAILRCSICKMEFSANAGDYWHLNPKTQLKCCETPLIHVVKVVRYVSVD